MLGLKGELGENSADKWGKVDFSLHSSLGRIYYFSYEKVQVRPILMHSHLNAMSYYKLC